MYTIIQTSYQEKYGNRWKNKFGSTYVLDTTFTPEQVEQIKSTIGFSNDIAIEAIESVTQSPNRPEHNEMCWYIFFTVVNGHFFTQKISYSLVHGKVITKPFALHKAS